MIGQQLSHYTITEELGRGGMGVVYKAEDMRLDRTVAIKVLPSATLASEDDRERFYREAKAAAQLHHPHIASVFEIDEGVPSGAPHDALPSPFIVMEYIDGETLAERISRSPLKIPEAVRIASEIASALGAAHEKNIIHRDIKSANVMVTRAGEAKVLDFGLAKTAQSTMLTRMGSTLGTFAYMSPEQAKGEEVDARTDLWALGVILYEIVSGRHPFPGDYEQAVVYSILNEDPEPLTGLRTGVSLELERIVTKLLAKDPQRRYQTVAGLRADLLGLEAPASAVSSRVTSVHSGASPITASHAKGSDAFVRDFDAEQKQRINPILAGVVIAAVLTSGVLIGALMYGTQRWGSSDEPVRKMSTTFDGISTINAASVSPDGKYLVFTGIDSIGPHVYIYSFEEGEITATYQDRNYVWARFSPDGRWVALSGLATGITTIRMPDGNPQQIVERGEWGVWESNESLLMRLNSQLYRVSASGGEPTLVATADSALGINRLWPLVAFPRERKALIAGAGIGETNRAIFAMDLDTGEYEEILDKAHAAFYVESGHLVYLQGGGLEGQVVVQPFSRKELRPYGIPVRLEMDAMYWTNFSVGSDGTILYGSRGTGFRESYSWIQLDNSQSTPITAMQGIFDDPLISNGGDQLLIKQLNNSSEQWDATIFDLRADRSPLRLIAGRFLDAVVWSPNDTDVYYSERDQSGNNSSILRISSNRGSAAEPIQTLEYTWVQDLLVHPDGQSLFYADRVSNDIFRFNYADSAVTQITMTSEEAEIAPAISPDGRFIAFQNTPVPGSDIIVIEVEGGGRWEIDIPQWTLRRPKWSSDGKYLYFSIAGGRIARHAVGLKPTFILEGLPEVIALVNGSEPMFDVHPDGDRMVVSSSSTRPQDEKLHFVFNFGEEAKRIAPTE